MATAYMFKAQCDTNRFRKNQKVWIRSFIGHAAALEVFFKWRGRSRRYATGVIDRRKKVIGEIREIEVSESFARAIAGPED